MGGHSGGDRKHPGVDILPHLPPSCERSALLPKLPPPSGRSFGAETRHVKLVMVWGEEGC